MKVSIFKNNSISIGVDYSNREDCIGVFEITETERELLENGGTYEIVDGELEIKEKEISQEEVKEFEKQKLFSEYKSNLDQIKELNAEIQEVEATAEYFPEVAEKRIEKLSKDRTELRTRNGQIIGIAIEKFGEEVVNEF